MGKLPLPFRGEGSRAQARSGEGPRLKRDARGEAPLPSAATPLPPSPLKGRGDWGWLILAFLLCLLALARPVDHDESQYVAAAVLTAGGLLPYRDYAYLQTPLQPFLFAPIAWAAGTVTWPALRLANALLGALAIRCVYGAAREIADRGAALSTAALFACTDILLFSIGTARNDALPAACLAGALWPALRAQAGRGTRLSAVATGLLLAAAAAAKISYALPAASYGLYALFRREHRPALVALGAAPVVLFVAWTCALSPEGFVFGIWTFPTRAPLDWYADRPWKLSLAAKLVDTAKFLALGPALLAVALVAHRRPPALLTTFLLAGALAALLPTPTWRQYLLPLLPPLFIALAWAWSRHLPGRAQRVATVVFAMAGLAPTLAALASGRPAMVAAMRQGFAILRAMDAAHLPQHLPVATLSPQFLPVTGHQPDPRFATGPFVFRSRGLFSPAAAWRLRLVSRKEAQSRWLTPASAILAGGEARWTSGDPALDRVLEMSAQEKGYRRQAVPGTPFRIHVKQSLPRSP